VLIVEVAVKDEFIEAVHL